MIRAGGGWASPTEKKQSGANCQTLATHRLPPEQVKAIFEEHRNRGGADWVKAAVRALRKVLSA